MLHEPVVDPTDEIHSMFKHIQGASFHCCKDNLAVTAQLLVLSLLTGSGLGTL